MDGPQVFASQLPSPKMARNDDPSKLASDQQKQRPGTLSQQSPAQSPVGGGEQQWQGDVVNSIVADSAPGSDHAGDDGDGYDSDLGSATSTSLSSSINDYMFENNRRYHKFKEGRYLLPNDELEQNREDMKHCMVMLLCNDRLHFAPLEHPQRVLDIGTGTGIWAIEMGDRYPGAEVIGIDLSPIQSIWVPPNVRFYIDDAEAEWVESEGSLDYAHFRHMGMAFRDWPKVLDQAYRVLKPGGWVELQDLRLVVSCDDGSMPASYGVNDFLTQIAHGFSNLGYNLRSLEENQARLVDAGFVNIEEKIWKVPVGVWPKDSLMKEVGMYNREVLAEALQGVGMGSLTRGLGWAAAEVEVFLAGVRKSLADSSVHSYYTFHVVYGQKPLK